MIDKSLIEKLHKSALAVYDNAYAPYSKFSVASALLCNDGRIFVGTNVENASYGLTRCAEQMAVGNAITNGCRKIVAVLVITKNGDSWPCGACRQILAEFNINMTVFIADKKDIKNEKPLSELLPCSFSSSNLNEK